MSVTFYMDVHVPIAVTDGLRLRGVDVLTAQEDGTTRREDVWLLDRATTLDRVLVSQDEDFVVEGAKRQAAGTHFPGVIYAHQIRVSIGQFVHDLEVIGVAGEPEDLAEQVLRLPL